MSNPVQRPASTSDARKRHADHTVAGHIDSRTGKPATVYTPPECLTPTPVPRGVPRLFVAVDGYGDLCVWENQPEHPSLPRPVLQEFHVKDTALWDAIANLVESGSVA